MSTNEKPKWEIRAFVTDRLLNNQASSNGSRNDVRSWWLGFRIYKPTYLHIELQVNLQSS